MTSSRYWPLPIAYFIAFGLIAVSQGLMAVAKAGEPDVPFMFKGWLWPLIIIFSWLGLEIMDSFIGLSRSDGFN